MSVRLGLCSVAFRALSIEEVAELASAAGVEAVEWGGDVHAPPGDLAAARRVADASAARGLTCSSYGSYLFAGAASEAAIQAALDSAETIGAPNIRVWTDWVGPEPEPRRRGEVIADLRAITAAAAERDLTVSLEYHSGTLTETPASTQRLLEEVGAPNLFTYWQPSDAVPVDELIEGWRAVRHHVSHLHVFRWRSSKERWPLAEGADLWPSVLATLPVGGRWQPERVAFIEFVRGDEPAQLMADVASLRSWLDALHMTDDRS